MAKAARRNGKPDTVIPMNRRRPSAKWQASHGMYITGQSMIDEVMMLADRMEDKWGAGRLRLIVGQELREKFDRQRYLLNQAIWYGELEDVRQHTARMTKAWNALDKAAENGGVERMPPNVWDVISDHGNVYAIVRNGDDAKAYAKMNRPARVFSLEEICRILDAQEFVGVIKDHFQEAEIVDYLPRSVGDAMDDVWDTKPKLDDPLDDEIPF